VNKTGWIIFTVVVIGILGGLTFLSARDKLDVNTIDTHVAQKPNTQNGNIGDHTFGNLDSKTILIGYSDFWCSHCATQNQNIAKLLDEYTGDYLYISRHFPLSTLRTASSASEAAGLQGKYREMTDLIFSTQSSWSSTPASSQNSLFESYAMQIGLDVEKYKNDLKGEVAQRIAKKINYDQALGRKDGVDGTPTFFLNGEKLSPDVWSDYENLTSALDSASQK
jgi:protein-disulfide isomerase